MDTNKKEEKKAKNEHDDAIDLSKTTQTLLASLKTIGPGRTTDEYTKITVSQTVSFIALMYEKVRNAIEYREDHLIRRAAIERIMKRRLTLNPEGKGESENILRELLWARYFANSSLGEQDIAEVQHIVNQYLIIRKKILTGRNHQSKQYLAEFLIQLITAEIEEHLTLSQAKRESDFTYFIFQTLKGKIKIEDCTEELRDTYLFIALEIAYRKSDTAYQRYHLFRLFYKPLSMYKANELPDMLTKLPAIFKKIDDLIGNPNVEKLVRFTRKQLPPYLILFSIIREQKENLEDIITSKKLLWTHVEQTAREKYAQIRSRLNNLAFRSLIYIFITKMVFALLLEVPVSQYFFHEVNYIAIAVNSVVPPLFMLLIILSVSIPGDDNTKRLFGRIIEITDADPSFEKSVAYITRKAKYKRPILVFGFTILYVLTFVVTLYLIHLVLSYGHFNILSEAVFVFFISVVGFFAYRLKQLANMYRLAEKPGVLQPITDFFFMPILSLGKFFSEGVSKINFFIVIFDFIIEAPFKLIIEVIEEWISFVRQKKEEIV